MEKKAFHLTTLPSIFGPVKTTTAKHCVKNLTEFIRHYENFNNFVLGVHSDKSICLKFSTLNLLLLSLITKFSSNSRYLNLETFFNKPDANLKIMLIEVAESPPKTDENH